jgi:hypothetical protein
VKNLDGKTDTAGPNPFERVLLADGSPVSSICKIYDWVTEDGIGNLGKWVEEAFQTRVSYKGEKNLKANHLEKTSTDNSSRLSSGPVTLNNPPQPWTP